MKMDTEVASFLAFIIGASIAVPYAIYTLIVCERDDLEDYQKAINVIGLPIIITFAVVVGRLMYKLFMWLP